MATVIHRMIDWERDPIGHYGDIVCGAYRGAATEVSIFASGYDCPECLAQTSNRQLQAALRNLIHNAGRIGWPKWVLDSLEQAADRLGIPPL